MSAHEPPATRTHHRRRKLWLACILACCNVGAACGGSTGHEGLPSAASRGSDAAVDAGADANVVDAGSDAADATEIFDASVQYADRELPDIQAPKAVDASVTEASADAGVAPDATTPCTTAPCAASGNNSVRCFANDGGICTQTEAIFVQIDIDNGRVTTGDAGAGTPSSQPTPKASCYGCLVESTAIDDDLYGDTCNECGDVSTPACLMMGAPPSAPPLDGEPRELACLDLVRCMLSSQPHCVESNPPTGCYCGTAAGTACLTAGAANGPCLQQTINGVGVGICTSQYPAPLDCTEGDPTQTTMTVTDKTFAAGMAYTIMGAAFQSCAALCGF